MKRRFRIVLGGICLFCLLFMRQANAAETGLEEFDFEAIQSFMEESFGKNAFDFQSLAQTFAKGDLSFSLDAALDAVGNLFIGQIRENQPVLVRVLVLAISAAVFSNIASVFKDSQISQNAWFVIYLMMCGTLIGGFGGLYQTAVSYLNTLTTFVKLLIPTFCMALSCVCGAAAMSVYYQLTFIMITAIDWLFLYLLLPGLKVYVCFALLNELTGEDYLSGFLQMLQLIFEWVLKTVTGVVVGLQVIQGLVIPAVGQAKGQFVSRLIQAVPGIGNGIRSASEILIGTGILIKNGIGAAGCLVIVAICLVPLVQMAVVVFLYYGAGALIQPISDMRVRNCITGTAYGIRMLLRITAIAAFLFAVSIALTCVFTNRVF